MSNKKYTYTLEAQYKGSGELGRLNADLKALGQIESMKKLSKDVLDLNRKFLESRRVLKEQAAEMKNADGVVKNLSASYKKSQQEVDKLSKAIDVKKLGAGVLELNRRFRESQQVLKQHSAEIGKSKNVSKEMRESYKLAQAEVKDLAIALDKAKVAYKRSHDQALAAGVGVDKFRTSSKKLNTQLVKTKQGLKREAVEMNKASRAAKKLSTSYKSQQASVQRLATALDKKKIAYKKSRAVIKAAGIDTKKLTAEEKRLATAAKATGQVWAARRTLGVRSHRDVKDEIGRLTLAYTNLKKSGTLTSSELLQAKQQLSTKVRILRTQTVAWGASLSKVHRALIGLAGFGYGIGRAFAEFSGFETGMAEVYTLVDKSKEKFAEFKAEISDITGDMPQKNKDLTKALYDLISAGGALDESTKVLTLAGRASVAGITDIQTAVNVGMGTMNSYGKSIDDLSGIYDILFQTVKSGVTNFPALAQNLGNVLPTARLAKVDLKEVGAAIAAMTKAGIKTPQAMTALKGAINALSAPAPEAARQFEDLKITWQGLVPTLEKLREKSLSIDHGLCESLAQQFYFMSRGVRHFFVGRFHGTGSPVH